MNCIHRINAIIPSILTLKLDSRYLRMKTQTNPFKAWIHIRCAMYTTHGRRFLCRRPMCVHGTQYQSTRTQVNFTVDYIRGRDTKGARAEAARARSRRPARHESNHVSNYKYDCRYHCRLRLYKYQLCKL